MIAPRVGLTALVAVAVLLGGCSSDIDTTEPDSRELVGFVTVTGSTALVSSNERADLLVNSNSPFAASCVGSGQYDKLIPTALISVRGAGEVVASGRLGDGQLIHVETVADPRGSGGCMWQFSIPAVPTGLEAYEIDVGALISAVYEEGKLDALDWKVDFKLP